MQKYVLVVISLAMLCASACGRFGNEDKKKDHERRIISASKQYTEIMYALGAAEDLVAVDISSSYPPEAQELPTIGYHMHLSAAGILSMNPTLFLYQDGPFGIGPEHVVRKLRRLDINMKSFDTEATDLASAKKLIREMGRFFNREEKADSLIAELEADMQKALERRKQYEDIVSVVIIHYGRATNMYLVVGQNSAAGQMIRWAGGKIPIDKAGMAPILSPEIIAKSNPDVILLTAYGYDRLKSGGGVLSLPGVALTNAAENNRIYRVDAQGLIYYGPRTGEIVLQLQKLIHLED